MQEGYILCLHFLNEDCHVDMGDGHFLEQRWVYELGMLREAEGEFELICDSNDQFLPLFFDLEALFKSCQNQKFTARLTPSVRSVIDRFMNETAGKPERKKEN